MIEPKDAQPPSQQPQQGADDAPEHHLPEPVAVIVVGSHLYAEVYDRPNAYRLQRALERRITDLGGEIGMGHIIVCTDIWYLNQEALRVLPCVSIGNPNSNAVAAYWAEKLPTVIAVDGMYIVQFDDGHGIPVASCWGADARCTHAAVDQFEKKWIDQFLGAIATP